jgi:predicted PurR-regulated permease PerM
MAETLGRAHKGGRDAADRPPEGEPAHVEITWRTIRRVLLTAVFVWVWLRLWPVIVVVLVAAVLAISLDPIVSWLERRRVPRGLGAVLLGVVVLCVVAGFVAATWTSLSAQAHLVTQQLQSLDQSIMSQVPPVLEPMARRAQQGVIPKGDDLGPYAVRAAQSVLSALVVFALGFVLTIYLLIDGQRTYHWMLAYVPLQKRPKVQQTSLEVRRVVRAYVVGNVATSCFAGLFVFVILIVLRVPAAMLLALLAALCDFLPVLGIVIAAFPALVLAATVSLQTTAAVAFLYLAYHAAENYLIGPKVYGDRLKLSDVGVILAFAVGLELGGIVGALLALPIAAAYPCVESLWLERAVGNQTIREHARLRDG